MKITRPKRLKSALYLRFKKIEGGTIWRQKYLEQKSQSAEKNRKGGPLGDKKIEKSRTVPKKLKGGPFSPV